MNEPRETSTDYIPDGYIIADRDYHAGEGIPLYRECKHGIYKLIKPRTLICTNCKQVIIDEQEMESFYQYLCNRD